MLMGPRLAIFLMFLMSDYLGKAYEMNLWPFLGFLFLPYTTLTYALAMNERGSLEGPYLVMWIGAIILDLYTTRVNGSGSSGVRVRVNEMAKRKTGARAVDARVIDIDTDKRD
jgi:hypothetical protein